MSFFFFWTCGRHAEEAEGDVREHRAEHCRGRFNVGAPPAVRLLMQRGFTTKFTCFTGTKVRNEVLWVPHPTRRPFADGCRSRPSDTAAL